MNTYHTYNETRHVAGRKLSGVYIQECPHKISIVPLLVVLPLVIFAVWFIVNFHQ